MVSEPDSSPLLHRGSARSVLLTILGELVEPEGQPVWNAGLLALMTELGFEPRTARQAIDRAAEAGWISGERVGRNVRWTLTPEGCRLISAGSRRVHATVTGEGEWDGRWLVLLVAVPSSIRAVRKQLYAALRWEGFGNPTPGLWLSPHVDRDIEATAIIKRLGLTETTFAFAGNSTAVGLSDEAIVHRAWDLDGLAAQYRQLLTDLDQPRPSDGNALLVAHVSAVNQWQRFPFIDPQLPEALLPEWIGRAVAARLRERRQAWTIDARDAWRGLVESTDPTR